MATPTVDTTGWAYFSNDRHGFQFRHPDACPVSELDGSFYVGRIALNIVDPEGLSLADFVNRFVQRRIENGSWRVDTISTGFMAGAEAVSVEYRFGGVGRYGTATFALKNSNIYAWEFTAGAFTCDEPAVYRAVVDSFRFTSSIPYSDR